MSVLTNGDPCSGASASALVCAGAPLLLFAAAMSIKGLYSIWMKFATGLRTVVVVALFTLCYVVVVPPLFVILWAFDPLQLRKHSGATTFWIQRRSPRFDPSSLNRMG